MTDISLITSLYQTEKFLPQYIEHVKGLSKHVKAAGLALEWVIIPNDASDRERHLLAQLHNCLMKDRSATLQLHYVHRESLYQSWNRGMQVATGQIIGILNVDDKRTVEGLVESYRLIHEQNFELVDFAFRQIINGTARQLSAQYNPQLLAPKTTLSPFWLCHRNLFQTVGKFNDNFRIVGDFEWSKRPATRQARVTSSDVIAGEFVLHGDNLSASQHPLEWVEYNIALIWHGGESHLRPVVPNLMRQSWENWGYKGGTISDETAQWLWGDGAKARYQKYTAERNQHPILRRFRLALARRGLWQSVEWDVHNG